MPATALKGSLSMLASERQTRVGRPAGWYGHVSCRMLGGFGDFTAVGMAILRNH